MATDAMPSTGQDIRPSVETLEEEIQPPSKTVCPVGECGQIFSNLSHLTLHKAKVHRIELDKLNSKEDSALSCKYFCPVESCNYHKNKHFANYKILKKHYGSVHGQKKFTCTKCNKGFGFKHAQKRHEATCGVIYNCKTCGCPYTTKEALLLHCSRKEHELPDNVKETMRKFNTGKKNLSKSKQDCDKTQTTQQPCIIFVSKMEPVAPDKINSQDRPILPKPIIERIIPMTRVMVGEDKVSVEKFSFPAKQTAEIQTDIFGVSNRLQQRPPHNTHRTVLCSNTATQVSIVKPPSNVPTPAQFTSTTGIQTNLSSLPKRKRHCSIAETQTSGDFILKSAMASAKIPFHDFLPNKPQRSPQSKGRFSKRSSVTTSEVQTRETFPPKKKRKRRNSGRQTVTSSCGTDRSHGIIPVPASQTQSGFLDNQQQNHQNTETQTNLSALLENMRKSLLTEENPEILSDLGITFNNSEYDVSSTSTQTQKSFLEEYRKYVGTPFSLNLASNTRGFTGSSVISNVKAGHSGKVSTFGDSDSAGNNSQSSIDFLSDPPPCFLELMENETHKERLDIPGQPGKSFTPGTPNCRPARVTMGTSPVSFDVQTDMTEAPLSRDHVATIATQVTPQKHSIAGTSTSDLYFSSYNNSGVDFGVQTSNNPQFESVLTKCNPCLSSTAAKDIQTQTMTPRSVDFGAQTLTSSPTALTFLEAVDNSQLEGPALMSSVSGTDMHTQTADDLLDFLMTNMETQTEELFTSGLGLSDIETQTPAENDVLDTLVTTETQTNMMSLVEEEDEDLTLSTDMETQTHFNVIEFETGDFTDSHTQTNFELFSI